MSTKALHRLKRNGKENNIKMKGRGDRSISHKAIGSLAEASSEGFAIISLRFLQEPCTVTGQRALSIE